MIAVDGAMLAIPRAAVTADKSRIGEPLQLVPSIGREIAVDAAERIYTRATSSGSGSFAGGRCGPMSRGDSGVIPPLRSQLRRRGRRQDGRAYLQ